MTQTSALYLCGFRGSQRSRCREPSALMRRIGPAALQITCISKKMAGNFPAARWTWVFNNISIFFLRTVSNCGTDPNPLLIDVIPALENRENVADCCSARGETKKTEKRVLTDSIRYVIIMPKYGATIPLRPRKEDNGNAAEAIVVNFEYSRQNVL